MLHRIDPVDFDCHTINIKQFGSGGLLMLLSAEAY